MAMQKLDHDHQKEQNQEQNQVALLIYDWIKIRRIRNNVDSRAHFLGFSHENCRAHLLIKVPDRTGLFPLLLPLFCGPFSPSLSCYVSVL